LVRVEMWSLQTWDSSRLPTPCNKLQEFNTSEQKRLIIDT
jgi:hypothetical protein